MTVPVAHSAASKRLRILLVEDDRALREGAVRVLESDGYAVTTAAHVTDAVSLLEQRRYHLIITDLQLGKMSGLTVLQAALAVNPHALVVVTTDHPSVESNIESLRAGAWDYLPKPYSAPQLQVMAARAAHLLAQQESTAVTQPTARARVLPATKREGVELLGSSMAFRRAVDLAGKVATTDASVMISGESGTGKELIAQFIHQNSRRANATLVPINCAALPDNLLESEMFGYRKGAFTGADRDKAGLLEVANGSTLFLDELTEMPMPLQAKLLRVLQDGVVRRLGSETQDAVVNVRFISATNRDPQEAVRQGVLREDLYYRLRVIPIKLPPLRQRPEDIVDLATSFLLRSWRRHFPESPPPAFAPETLEELQSRAWRGNVRELQNFVEHVAVLASAGSEIQPTDLPYDGDDDDVMGGARVDSLVSSALMDKPFHEAKDHLIADFEQRYVRHVTGKANGNMSRAARLAGIDRTTLYRLLEKHGTSRDDAVHS